MENIALTRNKVIEQLSASHHGELYKYMDVFEPAFRVDPEFTSHLLAWDAENGAIKDTQVALPIISLAPLKAREASDLYENSLAHLAMLDPRQFLRALEFARYGKTHGHGKTLRRLVERYVHFRQQSFGMFERVMLSHRKSMQRLMMMYHIKPLSKLIENSVKNVKQGGSFPQGSVLDVYSKLHLMEPREALGHVLNRGIPMKQVMGALGNKLKDNPDAVLAVINAATATEIVTYAPMLKKLGAETNPVLREAFRAKLREVSTAGKTPKKALLKAGHQAKKVTGETAALLNEVQEKQVTSSLSVKGRWAIGGDCSQSMQEAIEVTRFITSQVARSADETHLIFFNTQPVYKEVKKGMTAEQIAEMTKYITADGGTSPGVVIAYFMARNIVVDGVLIVTDGGERHAPLFTEMWARYVQQIGFEPTLYVFEVAGSDPNWLSERIEQAGILHEKFDFREKGVDFYSLPNTLRKLSTKRYTLIDAIMDTPLKTLDEVFSTDRKEVVNA